MVAAGPSREITGRLSLIRSGRRKVSHSMRPKTVSISNRNHLMNFGLLYVCWCFSLSLWYPLPVYFPSFLYNLTSLEFIITLMFSECGGEMVSVAMMLSRISNKIWIPELSRLLWPEGLWRGELKTSGHWFHWMTGQCHQSLTCPVQLRAPAESIKS